MLNLEKPCKVAGDAEQQRYSGKVGAHDAGAVAANGAGAQIGEPAAEKQHQRRGRAKGAEAVTIDAAEIMQFAQFAIVEADTKDVRNSQATAQRRRPNGDGGEQQHDGQRQPDIGDQAAHDNRNSGQKIACTGGDQIVGIVAEMPDRRRVADLGGGGSTGDRPFTEYKPPCRRHARAERSADIAATRHRGEIIDPPNQVVVVQGL